jgi:hypothetical protein
MGRTVRFDQIYVSRLDSNPLNDQNIQTAGGNNILTVSNNIGIGTGEPKTKLHLFNGVQRIESSTSNAIIEFKTIGGTSNIHSDTLGNVHIIPGSSVPTTIIRGDLDVSGSLNFGGILDGNIALGDNNVGIGLSGNTANTLFHVNGGFISNSDQVACKRYSKTFEIDSGGGQDVQLTFGTQLFYAKIVAMLKNRDDISKTSTMILEIQGGTHDGSVNTLPSIIVGTKKVISGTNPNYWNSEVMTGTRSIDIRPINKDTGVNYSYDIFIEIITSTYSGIQKITNNIININTDLNNAVAGQNTKAVFTY